MNELFPIIRRKRRPLIVEESVLDRPPKPLLTAGDVEPVQAVADAVSREVGEVGEGKANDANPASTRNNG